MADFIKTMAAGMLLVAVLSGIIWFISLYPIILPILVFLAISYLAGKIVFLAKFAYDSYKEEKEKEKESTNFYDTD